MGGYGRGLYARLLCHKEKIERRERGERREERGERGERSTGMAGCTRTVKSIVLKGPSLGFPRRVGNAQTHL